MGRFPVVRVWFRTDGYMSFYRRKTGFNRIDPVEYLFDSSFDPENYKWENKPDQGEKKTYHPQHDH